MSDFSSNVASSASLDDTYTLHIYIILDCCLCIHYNIRLAFYYVSFYSFINFSLECCDSVDWTTGRHLAFKMSCSSSLYFYILINYLYH